MKFVRTDLIEQVKAEIHRRGMEAAQRTADARDEYAANLAGYLERTSAGWSKLADTIRRRVRTGQPMTAEDVPAELGGGRNNWARQGGYIAVWDDKGPARYAPDVAGLKTLLTLLESSPSEQLSTTELENMGFKMRELFRTR